MPSLSLTRVNQKLAQAKALLDGVAEHTLTPVHRNSLKEAATFHLVCAYQHYLHEIAENYWLKNIASIRTEADLIAAFEVAKKHPVEAEELIVHRKAADSWLAQLHTYYESLWLLPVVTVIEPKLDDALISVVNIELGFDLAMVDLVLIASWHKEFVGLVVRQRETSAEF